MAIIRNGYCRYCSTDKEDVRDLIFTGEEIICENCRKISRIVTSTHSSYYYIEGLQYD